MSMKAVKIIDAICISLGKRKGRLGFGCSAAGMLSDYGFCITGRINGSDNRV